MAPVVFRSVGVRGIGRLVGGFGGGVRARGDPGSVGALAGGGARRRGEPSLPTSSSSSSKGGV